LTRPASSSLITPASGGVLSPFNATRQSPSHLPADSSVRRPHAALSPPWLMRPAVTPSLNPAQCASFSLRVHDQVGLSSASCTTRCA
jgi:hypothetical protein